MHTPFVFRRGFLVPLLYLLLLVLAVPWYWPADETRLIFGFPIWVLTAILIGFIAACLTAWLLLRQSWPDVDDQHDGDGA